MQLDEMVDSFAAEIQILGYIRHRNIVRLIGYCSNGSDVYSYILFHIALLTP
jgi:serine/threonine protein kinase